MIVFIYAAGVVQKDLECMYSVIDASAYLMTRGSIHKFKMVTSGIYFVMKDTGKMKNKPLIHPSKS